MPILVLSLTAKLLTLQNVTLSTNDLLSCCGFECGDGCDGGWPERAWEYFERSGVVSEQVRSVPSV